MQWILIALVAGAASFGGSYAASTYPVGERKAAETVFSAARAACPELGQRLSSIESLVDGDAAEKAILERWRKKP